MISLRIVGNEVSALGTAALAMPLRFLLRGQPFDPHAPNPTPVVLVHGFLGDPTNFLALRSHLAARGIRNFVNFSYPPRLDYQRLACRLGQTVEAVCGHWSLLYHPAVLEEVARFLSFPLGLVSRPRPPLALQAS